MSAGFQTVTCMRLNKVILHHDSLHIASLNHASQPFPCILVSPRPITICCLYPTRICSSCLQPQTQLVHYMSYPASTYQNLLFVIPNPITTIALPSLYHLTRLAVIQVLLALCDASAKRHLHGLLALIFILVVADHQLPLHPSEF